MKEIVANRNFPPPLRRGIKGVGNSNKYSLQKFIVILGETQCSEVSKPHELPPSVIARFAMRIEAIQKSKANRPIRHCEGFLKARSNPNHATLKNS